MSGNVSGKVVIVTESGQGIDESIARMFPQAGASVVVDGGSTLPENQVVMDGFYE